MKIQFVKFSSSFLFVSTKQQRQSPTSPARIDTVQEATHSIKQTPPDANTRTINRIVQRNQLIQLKHQQRHPLAATTGPHCIT